MSRTQLVYRISLEYLLNEKTKPALSLVLQVSDPLELATLPLEIPVRSCLFSMNTTQWKGNSVSIILPDMTHDPETQLKRVFFKTTDSVSLVS